MSSIALLRLSFLLLVVHVIQVLSFSTGGDSISSKNIIPSLLTLSSSSEEQSSAVEPVSYDDLDALKSDLFRCCNRDTKPMLDEIENLVNDIDSMGKALGGIGTESSKTGLLSGKWELLYSPEDITRSSPFFWAFRNAFPDASDQIFGITDSIPSPIKDVGPAYQEIDFNEERNTGSLVSRVKVATFGGQATSIMTTRTKIIDTANDDGIVLQIQTTKPEESTLINKIFTPLGLADFIEENAPPFPSGEALEKVKAGSSEVTMYTTYCDETLRITRYNDRTSGKPFVWKRTEFINLYSI